MKKFNHLEFYNLLQKGLGRTFDYIKQNFQDNREEIRQGLLNACLHNTAYDPQCEGNRGIWLFELISLTGDEAFYRQKIMQALHIETEFWDIDQLYTLVAMWAAKGDMEARELIYNTFANQEFQGSWLGGKEIVNLDEIIGLVWIAKVVGKKILADETVKEDDFFLANTCNFLGKREIIEVLKKASLNDKRIKAYLAVVKSHIHDSDSVRETKVSKRNTLSFSNIIKQIENTKYSRFLLARFGRNATDTEIERIFDRLLQEKDRDKLIGYLWVFKNRQFPRLDKYLFELAQSNDEQLQKITIQALANHQDRSIRDLAIKLVTKQERYIKIRTLKLFINNYQDEDFDVIKSILNSDLDIDEKHYFCMDLMEIIDENKNSDLTQFAFWIYENTPCSVCRESILEKLIESQQVTQTILRECLNDCSLDIRDIAKEKLGLV